METIHIFTAANNDYSKPLAVMLNSLLSNYKADNPLNIYILTSDITEDNQQKIQASLIPHSASVQFIIPDGSLFAGQSPKGYWSIEAYYRLIIPSILNETAEKAIYFDCDTIIKEDISKLWNHYLGDYTIGAAEDCSSFRQARRLRIPRPYVNSGVLLFNLKKWREENLQEKVLHCLNTFSNLTHPDQDALNIVLSRRIMQLDTKWNYPLLYRRVKVITKVKARRSGRIIRKRYSYKYVIKKQYRHITPAIIHYVGPGKPWKVTDNPLHNDYWQYEGVTNWPD
ncbi:glycosyltransferase family 8 protein [Neobacillus sp. NPDC093182]|uniref:glycosyltransferase family 8 protein n=1 Tax=Neobacillus sp. NPDC093182 TaxID=3364297 RepID=UPI003811ADC8